MTFKVDNEEVIEELAKAMNGPYDLDDMHSPSTLQMLRVIRWNQLSQQEQGHLKIKVRSILKAMRRRGIISYE